MHICARGHGGVDVCDACVLGLGGVVGRQDVDFEGLEVVFAFSIEGRGVGEGEIEVEGFDGVFVVLRCVDGDGGVGDGDAG